MAIINQAIVPWLEFSEIGDVLLSKEGHCRVGHVRFVPVSLSDDAFSANVANGRRRETFAETE